MTDRFDIMRSWVRLAADQAVHRITRTKVAVVTKQLLERLTQQRWRLSDELLTSAAAHADGVDSAMVACHSGRMFVDASMSNGKEVQFSLAPRSVRFAPRGAKEISFDVEPPDAHDTSIVGALAGCIAKATWPMITPRDSSDFGGAIVEREAAGRLRVDLRSIPAVRRFALTQTAAMIFDILELESLRVEPGALALKLKLPQLAP
ncbi:MAG: hypothetical protein GQ551_12800 [Myxococcales bacterium]|jgi:hypothetical protein|nr:hypothetical protein [Deltaproteobacteria bacterium]MBW2403163.1 hypothetical protein [Deltaproteobacteria bacterium]MBW2545906.1 hypothetical protein [Deltaproteobacteria bacterium]NOQ84880.1 hypothetical protein [Myxococcales bacterium]RLB45417.1 MAG: hypothetical protein DRH23_14415 [Deltaproteobacteria bacterium]